MKIYTKTGDTGETALYGGRRVGKDHPRVAAYSEVDATNVALGQLRTLCTAPQWDDLDRVLQGLQGELFDLGADLATPLDAGKAVARFTAADTGRLETLIDAWQAELPPQTSFTLPEGTPAAVAAHQARIACRRAEQRTVTLQREEPINPETLRYLNRLSDLLFVLTRLLNHRVGHQELPWSPRPPQD